MFVSPARNHNSSCDDGLQMKLLRGQEREALGKIEAHLMAEQAQRAGAGAVAALHSTLAHRTQKIEISLHCLIRFQGCSHECSLLDGYPRGRMAANIGVAGGLIQGSRPSPCPSPHGRGDACTTVAISFPLHLHPLADADTQYGKLAKASLLGEGQGEGEIPSVRSAIHRQVTAQDHTKV